MRKAGILNLIGPAYKIFEKKITSLKSAAKTPSSVKISWNLKDFSFSLPTTQRVFHVNFESLRDFYMRTRQQQKKVLSSG